ncbi:EAL domain-containing protein [Octadecabacter sp. 1_MG-2023]|uniref:EAL domain-containing protein n=2 Tax=unclassified Octadecabacter TaxID=196158 RepID=UPI001C08C4A4|nr:EAL domain-containing protein [Octadecabacter sp. 1_MG-2023]MBU2994582.1 EAL domain-containing protein [Octadecabacter sp. B2R22]
MPNPPPTKAIVPNMIEPDGDVIMNALTFARSHLDMEVAFLARIVGDDLVFETVVGPETEKVIVVGQSVPMKSTLSQYILEGLLPELITDVKDFPFIQDLGVLKTIKIQSHVGIPIYDSEGAIYGMFSCVDSRPRPSLNARDLKVMRAFASLSADQIIRRLAQEEAAALKRKAIESVLEGQSFEIALQPIMRLQGDGTAGYEALCRFSPEPYRAPNLWFDDAAEAGLQVTLELLVIEAALALLPHLPPESYLAVNSSPNTLATGKIAKLLDDVDGSRVLVEITEHAEIANLDQLLMAIDQLREQNVRIAVDDAGAGYSGLQQIVRLRPEVIKLDMSLTQDVDKDLARRSLASAMVQFAKDTNARVVAEGIETEAEMRTLKRLGVDMGQGYHLGRPKLAANMFELEQTA